jgi:serine/threonine protein kinase
MILNQPPPDLAALRPDTPPALVDLISRMLEKDRNKRISSVRLVGVEIEALIRGHALILPHALAPTPPVADRLDPRIATPLPGRIPIHVTTDDQPTVVEPIHTSVAPSTPPTPAARPSAPQPTVPHIWIIGGMLVAVMVVIALVATAALSR